MAAPKPLHPNKLYSMLRECTDARARAEAVLDYLVNHSGARAGYVLLARGGELVVVASSDSKALPSQLMERARALWLSDLASHTEQDKTRTVDARQLASALIETQPWQDGDGEHYEPRVLGMYRGTRWIPVGISVLAADPLESRRIRQPQIDAICKALLDAGDVAENAA